MELRHLRYFVALAQELSFTRAAGKLRLAQPSLTRQIHNLEEELGVRLLDRTRNGVLLTNQGRFFLTDARRLLELSDESIRAVREFNGNDSAHLNIGYLPKFDSGLLPATLNAFHQASPGISVSLFDMSPAEQLRALNTRTIDLGFVGLRPDVAGQNGHLSWACVARHGVVAVLPARRPWIGSSAIHLSDLKPQAFVAISGQQHPGWREWLLNLCGQAGFSPRIIQEVSSESGLLSFVADGLGVTLACDRLKNLPHRGVMFRPVMPPGRADYWMAWHRKNRSRPVRQYVSVVRQKSAVP